MKDIDKNNIIRERLSQGESSPLRTYMDLTVGRRSFFYFMIYEIYTSFLGPMPGGIGFYLRRKFYPHLFKSVGKGLIIGRNVVIRHPDKISLGDYVTIDDNCLLDARGAGSEGLVLEERVILNRNCMLQAKAGPIRLGSRTSIGSNSSIVSQDGVDLGEAVLIAGGCYISAGAYRFEDLETAIMDQPAFSKGPISIGAKSWLGTGTIVLDGVSIGSGAVIGAGAVVSENIDDNAIAVGIPAKIIRYRGSF
ncbi:MAG: acyltransferase [Desulfobacterales bacterium]|nr:acyltransferase [Desulfobacterales bacterium]